MSIRDVAVEPASSPCLNVAVLTETRPVTAVHVVQIVAILRQELGVGGVECQSISARLELGDAAVALEVLVTGMSVRVEPVVVWALEAVLSQR
jgi:hypothetical protein